MSINIIVGDCRNALRSLPADSIHCAVTSPPYYGLRDYGVDGQLGLEETPDAYIAEMVAVFREVRRVLQPDGTLWLNIGDSYCAPNGGFSPNSPSNLAGSKQAQSHPHATKSIRSHIKYGCKPKDLIGIPWMLAFALRADGWWLRQDIIWSKPNPMPESVTDRCTKAHEYLFLLSKSARYYYDADAIRDPQLESNLNRLKSGWNGDKKRGWPGTAHNNFDRYMGKSDEEIAALKGANKRSVWEIATQPFAEAHFATFPPALIEPCILAGCPEGGTVLDPFGGSGTTGLVADRLNRHATMIELNPAYAEMAIRRIQGDAPLFAKASIVA